MDIRGLRNGAIIAVVASMALLLIGGSFAKDRVAPIPARVVVQGDDKPLFGRNQIMEGQNVFQRYGLMDHGSIWGNGTYRGMDFSADTLHRIGLHMRDVYAARGGSFPIAGRCISWWPAACGTSSAPLPSASS